MTTSDTTHSQAPQRPRLRSVPTSAPTGAGTPPAPSLESDGVPSRFIEALTSVRYTPRPQGLAVEEVPAPRHLAPWTAALSAQTLPIEIGRETHHPEPPVATGRLVILHDPDCQDAWDGDFRLVMQVRARLDDEVGTDPALAEAAWSWLTQSLEESAAGYHALVGTVTRVLSDTFGGLQLTDACAHAEIRASWTPNTADLEPHIGAWYDLVRIAGGLEPEQNPAFTPAVL